MLQTHRPLNNAWNGWRSSSISEAQLDCWTFPIHSTSRRSSLLKALMETPRYGLRIFSRIEKAIATKLKLRRRGTILDINQAHIQYIEGVLGAGNGPPLVVSVEPERLNERISIQQGLFLFPCDLNCPFTTNLASPLSLTYLKSSTNVPSSNGMTRSQNAYQVTTSR